jgi:cytochrome b
LVVFSAIIGLAISFAVLHIACEIRYSKSKTERYLDRMLVCYTIFKNIEHNTYLVKIRPHCLEKLVQPINLY